MDLTRRPPQTEPPSGRAGVWHDRLRRPLGYALAILAVLYPLYLLAGNVFLGRHLLPLLNRHPERLLVQYRTASTVWPGVVHVEGLTIRAQTRAVQWWGAVDRGTFTIDLPKLLRRELEAEHARGTGVAFRLRRRLDAPHPSPQPPSVVPGIPGLANPPRPPPEALVPRARRADPWTIDLRGMELDGVREVWVEQYRFAGRARAAGGFTLTLRRRAEVVPCRFQFAAGEITIAGRRAIDAMSGSLDVELAPFDPRRRRGLRQVFAVTSGRARLRGRVAGLGLVRQILARSRWVDLEGGAGPFTADLRVARGEPLAGSWVTMRPGAMAARFLDYRATGSGRLRWSLSERPGGAPGAVLAVDLAGVRIQRDGYRAPHVRGERLALRLSGEQPRDSLLLVPRRIALDLPQAEVPDLTFYNAYLPRGLGIALESGSGRLQSRFAAAAPAWRGRGSVRLRGTGVVAEIDGQRVRGDLDLTTRIADAELRDRSFDLAGTDLHVARLTLLDAPAAAAGAWWARLHVERGRLALREPVFLRAELEASLRDPAPLLAFLGARNPRLRWLDRLRAVQGIAATTRVALGAEQADLDPLVVVGGKGRIHGRLRLRQGVKRGVLLLSYGPLAAGLEFDGAERDWKLVRPRGWYASRTAAAR